MTKRITTQRAQTEQRLTDGEAGQKPLAISGIDSNRFIAAIAMKGANPWQKIIVYVCFGLILIAIFLTAVPPYESLKQIVLLSIATISLMIVLLLIINQYAILVQVGKLSPQIVAAKPICGFWWELIHNHPELALSYVRIGHSDHGLIDLEAEVYNSKGLRVARWRSAASCQKVGIRELFYFWDGDEYNRIDEQFSGIGTIHFDQPDRDGVINSGVGWFTMGNLHAMQLTTKQKVDMRRLSTEEQVAMAKQDDNAKAQLVLSVYSTWVRSLPDRGL